MTVVKQTHLGLTRKRKPGMQVLRTASTARYWIQGIRQRFVCKVPEMMHTLEIIEVRAEMRHFW